MKIPREEDLVFVIKSVLHRENVNSQKRLKELVDSELKKADPHHAVSARRLRKVVASIHGIEMRTRTRKGKEPVDCPSCSSSLKKHWTKNLKGEKVPEHMECNKCGYRGHEGKWVPRKYEFRIERK